MFSMLVKIGQNPIGLDFLQEKKSSWFGENTDRNNRLIAKRETNTDNDRKRYGGEWICGFAENLAS